MPDEAEAMRPLRGGTRSGRAAKAIMGSARGGTPVSNEEELRAGVEYRRYEAMGLEIRDALLRRGREQVRNEAVAGADPKAALSMYRA